MIKHILQATLSGLLLLASCKNNPAPPPPAQPSGNDLSAKSSEPDPNDLLRTLQGRWQSVQDPTFIVEIADTQMRHFSNGKLVAQSEIEVDGACETQICKPEGVDTSDGWCFSEKPTGGDASAAQCNFVTLCDKTQLKYRALSGAGNEVSFKKIQ